MSYDILSWLREHEGERTVLGICPIAEEIVRAAIREAAENMFVPMFVATPRQIDADRGYTKWSQSTFVTFIDDVREEYGYSGPCVLARDHGGPYQSTRDRDDPHVKLSDAMRYARELFAEDVAAGFDLIHVDATADPRVSGPLALNEVARRTTELIEAIETERKQREARPIYYEVGTEEVAGGMTDPGDFGAFLDLLNERFASEGLGVFDRVVFAVGQVGTTMRIDMTNEFDPDRAMKLTATASERDVFLKVHYTDWLPTSTLERFPEYNIGAANVGPEFTAAIVESLAELEREERRLLDAADETASASGFMTTMEEAAARRSPWRKFAPESLNGTDRAEFVEENRRNIALCVGRYVLNDPDVRSARDRLYENVRTFSAIDPHETVIEGVAESIDRYVDAFNLSGER